MSNINFHLVWNAIAKYGILNENKENAITATRHLPTLLLKQFKPMKTNFEFVIKSLMEQAKV